MRGTTDPYFDWLCILTGIDNRIQGRNYGTLASALHSHAFRAKIQTDSNLGMDGMRLRVEFMQRNGPLGSSTNRGPCTMLEFLIALSRHMSFFMTGNKSGHHTEYYFWSIINNIGLSKLTDDRWEYLNGDFHVEDTIWRIVSRNYDPDGNGGLFPLLHPSEDQRQVEIWYQMHSWLGEHCEIDLSI